MLEKVKSIGMTGGGILLFIALITIPILIFLAIVRGGVWLVEHYIDLIQQINGWVFLIILLLLLLSIFPRLRIFTGMGISYGTLVWGALFWLFCLFITYELWGFFGVLAGLVIFGVGVFVTAILALLFDSQWSIALITALNLILIFGVRALGFWIATKYKVKEESPAIEDSSIMSEFQLLEPKSKLSEATVSKSHYCSSCGNMLEMNSKFCTKCGAKI